MTMRIGNLERLYILNKKASNLILDDCNVHFKTIMNYDIDFWGIAFSYTKYNHEYSDTIYLDKDIMNVPVDVLVSDSTTFKFENNYLKLSDIGKETLNNI